jgi:hypothetical protein
MECAPWLVNLKTPEVGLTERTKKLAMEAYIRAQQKKQEKK